MEDDGRKGDAVIAALRHHTARWDAENTPWLGYGDSNAHVGADHHFAFPRDAPGMKPGREEALTDWPLGRRVSMSPGIVNRQTATFTNHIMWRAIDAFFVSNSLSG